MTALETAVQKLLGSWKSDPAKSENFEQFLEATGHGDAMKSAALATPAILKLSVDGGNLVIVTDFGSETRTASLPLDGSTIEVVETEWGTGKLSMGLEDDKVVITSTFDNDKGNMTVSREVMDDQLIQMMNVGDGKVICKRTFEKV